MFHFENKRIAGVFWRTKDVPFDAIIQSNHDFYSYLQGIFQLAPDNVYTLSIKTDSSLLKILKDPSKSVWHERFKARVGEIKVIMELLRALMQISCY